MGKHITARTTSCGRTGALLVALSMLVSCMPQAAGACPPRTAAAMASATRGTLACARLAGEGGDVAAPLAGIATRSGEGGDLVGDVPVARMGNEGAGPRLGAGVVQAHAHAWGMSGDIVAAALATQGQEIESNGVAQDAGMQDNASDDAGAGGTGAASDVEITPPTLGETTDETGAGGDEMSATDTNDTDVTNDQHAATLARNASDPTTTNAQTRATSANDAVDSAAALAEVATGSASLARTTADDATGMGTSTVSLRAEWDNHPLSDDAWSEGGGQDAGAGNGRYYQCMQLKVNKTDNVDGGIAYGVSLCEKDVMQEVYQDGDIAGTSGECRAIEDVRIWLTGTLARCYDVEYEALMMSGLEYVPVVAGSGATPSLAAAQYPGWAGATFKAKNMQWTHITPGVPVVYESRFGSIVSTTGGAVGIRRLTVDLVPRSYENRIDMRLENADGTWGDAQTVRTTTNAYASVVPGWVMDDDDTYQGAHVDAYRASYEDTVIEVNVARKTATNTICARFQNADGSWGDPTVVSCGSDRVGATRTWTHEADETYEAATASIVGTAHEQSVEVRVPRRSCVAVFKPDDTDEGTITVTKLAGNTYGDDLPQVARTGRSFVGWFTQPEGGEAIDATSMVKSGTYYAHWESLPQLRICVPVAIRYVASADGSLAGPADGSVAITNDGDVDAIVSAIHAEAADGLAIVSGTPQEGELALSVTPGEGSPETLGGYAQGKAPAPSDGWTIAAGGRLALNGLTGRMGAAFVDGTRAVGAIHWTFAAVGWGQGA